MIKKSNLGNFTFCCSKWEHEVVTNHSSINGVSKQQSLHSKEIGFERETTSRFNKSLYTIPPSTNQHRDNIANIYPQRVKRAAFKAVFHVPPSSQTKRTQNTFIHQNNKNIIKDVDPQNLFSRRKHWGYKNNKKVVKTRVVKGNEMKNNIL